MILMIKKYFDLLPFLLGSLYRMVFHAICSTFAHTYIMSLAYMYPHASLYPLYIGPGYT